MNTTHTTQKNRWYKFNINHRNLTYKYFFITYEPFQPVVQGGIVY
jgi:hypothetical protein